MCSFCQQAEENANHLFFNCRFAQSMCVVQTCDPLNHLQQHYIEGLSKEANDAWMVTWFAVVWFLWIQRNAIIFNNEQKDEGKVWETYQNQSVAMAGS